MLYEQFSKLQKDKNITLTDIVVLKTEATAVLQGQFKGLGLKENCIYQEYNDLILYIENLDRDQFSEIFKKNAKLIAKSCFLSIAIAQKKKDLPFESTYVKEFTDEKRGKRLINTGDPVYTEKYQLKKNEVFRLHVGIASYDKKLSNCHKQVKQIENDIANFNDKPSEDETSDEEQNPLSLENLNQDLQTEKKIIDSLTEEKNILNEMLVKLNLELLDLEKDIQDKLATNPFSIVKGIFKKDMHSKIPPYATHMLKPSFFERPPEYSQPEPTAEWNKHLGERLVIPFVNSFSGTLFAQLRIFKLLQLEYNNEENVFIHNNAVLFEKYLKSMISLLLYASGGHSLHEFFYPFSFDEVKEKLSFRVNISNIFINENEIPFQKALEETIKYNHLILNNIIEKKRELHSELLSSFPKKRE